MDRKASVEHLVAELDCGKERGVRRERADKARADASVQPADPLRLVDHSEHLGERHLGL